jgi:hypothetical protein
MSDHMKKWLGPGVLIGDHASYYRDLMLASVELEPLLRPLVERYGATLIESVASQIGRKIYDEQTAGYWQQRQQWEKA